MSRRTVTILGATGSVGRSTLDLITRHAERYEVVALTAGRDAAGLAEAARRVGARRAVVADEAAYPALREALADALGEIQALATPLGQEANLSKKRAK